ncbi:MAG TPA: dTMP kinase [Vicinamibacteria bacterium]|nr:dTMP kinase [Vicinamibacteria bacterium]
MAFITLEGIEGSGKSTQARRLAEALGAGALLTQEPGGTTLGRSIRGLLLEHRDQPMSPAAEALLFFADRAQHVAEVIRPALRAGRHVISDRHTDSSLAYQGLARGLDLRLLRALAELATGGLRPDLTVLIDVPVAEGLARVGRRGASDRLEAERVEFHERVRAGYLRLAAEEPSRWAVVDGRGGEDEVAARVIEVVESRGLRASHGVR